MSIKLLIISALRDLKKSSVAILLKFKYKRTIYKLRGIYGTRKIRVVFGVSEIAKWKSQSLYDELESSESYRPIVCVYPSILEIQSCPSELNLHLQEKVNFFKAKRMEVYNVWDSRAKKCVFPRNILPDIIFYQQPWDIPPFLSPYETANFALTFYIPYYLINNFDINIEFGNSLHHQIFRYIVLNEEAVNLYMHLLTRRHYAGNCIGLGHTIVDSLTFGMLNTKGKSVIYAPHFSFPVSGQERILTYSTFLENGKLILEYAKQHSEIEWVFKPHPRLRVELENTGVWKKEDIDAYYDDWAKIGIVCTTSDYIDIFQDSFAMITDCGSFLTEYSCMDKPLIRLFYHKENLPPNPILEKLYDTFYYVHNNKELIEYLDLIIIKRQDPKKMERHKEVTTLGLNQSNSAQKIVNYIDSLLSNKVNMVKLEK